MRPMRPKPLIPTCISCQSLLLFCSVYLALAPTLTTMFAGCGCVWGTVRKSELVATGLEACDKWRRTRSVLMDVVVK
jgi:hypothetical protein